MSDQKSDQQPLSEQELQAFAKQLSHPEGEQGKAIGEKMNEGNALMLAKSIAMLSPQVGETVVEIGPGTGVLSKPIVESIGASGRYIGVEQSKDMAAIARQNLSPINSNVEIFNGNCLEAIIAENSIDAIIASNVLYFIDDLEQFFARGLTWLKANGRVVFAVRSQKVMQGLPFTQYGFTIRSVDSIMESLSGAGFIGINAQFIIDDPSRFTTETDNNQVTEDTSKGSIIITASKS